MKTIGIGKIMKKSAAFLLLAAILTGGCGIRPEKTADGSEVSVPVWEKLPVSETAEKGEGMLTEKKDEADVSDRVYVPGPYGRISVEIPDDGEDDWWYEVLPVDDERLVNGCYGLRFGPDGPSDGSVDLSYIDQFGVCGTGLETADAAIAGKTAQMGIYDGGKFWNYIRFGGDWTGVTAISSGTGDWPDDIKSRCMEILETLRFEPEIREGGTGFFRPDSEIEKIEVQALVKNVTSSGATVVFRSYGRRPVTSELIYGEDYSLEKKNGDSWEALPTILDDWAFTAVGYTVVPGETSEWKADWEWLYGKIGPGEYRIGKSIMDWRSPGDFDQYVIYAYFLFAGEPGGSGEGQQESGALPPAADDASGILAASAELPDNEWEGMSAEQFLMSDAHWNWWQDSREKVNASAQVQDKLDAFNASAMKSILASEPGRNAVCSPLNLYMALSMAAELSDTGTREEFLQTLGVSDMEELRRTVKAVWEANYADTPALKSLPANSLWLRNDIGYHREALEILSKDYHASSFIGEMGADETDRALRNWINEQTCGLLKEESEGLHLEDDTVLALVSTIYFKASWMDRFGAERTKPGVFHGSSGDREVLMMHQERTASFYRAPLFTAVGLHLNDSGRMFFLLPEEGTDPEEVVCDPALPAAVRTGKGMEEQFSLVRMTIPKFSVREKTDLKEVLPALGIRRALSPDTADFSLLTDEAEKVYISGGEHAAVVEIDEEGVTGAAYTELAMAAGAALPPEPVDFILDRPFVFLVTGRDGSILFAGIVRDIG